MNMIPTEKGEIIYDVAPRHPGNLEPGPGSKAEKPGQAEKIETGTPVANQDNPNAFKNPDSSGILTNAGQTVEQRGAEDPRLREFQEKTGKLLSGDVGDLDSVVAALAKKVEDGEADISDFYDKTHLT